MTAPHGRRHIALEQLALTRLDHGEADAPDAAPEEIHAEQPGDQEVDVARARSDRAVVADGDEILPTARPLQYIVDFQACKPTLGASRVVAVDDGLPRHHQQRNAAGA